MNRYFLEVAYNGTRYSGFQVQENAVTIQSEVEKALEIFLRKKVELTGSSRTDAGVHALQNYFHFDFTDEIGERSIYNLNALLPDDIAINSMHRFAEEDGEAQPHCRFDAIARDYRYYVYKKKDPFLRERAYYFPYTLDVDAMREAAAAVKEYEDFTSFSKRNTQVKNFVCRIAESGWMEEGEVIVYRVKANRFLRGMVKAMVGTMLQVGRGKMSVAEFRKVIEAKDCTMADFSAPGQGLFLVGVEYPKNFFL